MADLDNDKTDNQASGSNGYDDSIDSDSKIKEKSSFIINGTIVRKSELKKLLKSSALEDVERLNQLVVKILEEDDYKTFKYLMKHSYKLDVLNSKGQTAVHIGFSQECDLIHWRHVRDSLYDCYDEFDTGKIISALVHKWLLKRRFNLDHVDSNGLTYLHIACFLADGDMEKKNLVKKCLKNKCNVNAQFNDPEGRYKNFTPLHFAVINSCKESANIVEKLLVPGIKLDAKDFLGRTPLHLICQLYKDPDDVYYHRSFDKYENISTMVHQIFKEPQNCYMNSLDIIDLLIKCGMDVNMKDKNGNTPLLSIFPTNYKEFVRFKYDWLEDEIPIMEIAMKFVCLLGHGAKVNLRNKAGDTILHLILRNLKAYCNSEESWNKYLFSKYSDQYHLEMIKLIFNSEQKVQVNAKNKKGETPIQWAVESLNIDAVQLLVNHGANFKHLKFDCADSEKFFSYPNIVPNFEATQNLISIIEILQSKGFNLTPKIKLVILDFIVHNVKKCECRSDMRLAFSHGSTSHFKYLLNKSYSFSKEDIRSFPFYYHRLTAGNLYVDKEFEGQFRKLNSIEASDTEIEAQINLMKSIKVSDDLNLHDLLTIHPHNVPYVIAKNFDYNFLKDLDFYENYVKSHFTKRIVRRFVEKMCEGCVKKLCGLLPDLCCQLIVDYLDNEDIVNVYSIVNSLT